ncbi:MAG TPA: type II toxin-antitoxin system RelE/ParE family toxin [Thermoanaerobaculia bacterium]|nr:type II toxin-antitoxin system RelE/ParE family toxin [Thermoanaerobaculia bacterium]
MRLVLRRVAKRDLAEARSWYDERRAGLGKEFLFGIEATLSIIRNHPYMFPRVDPRVRRATVKRFPYGVFYMVDGETIRVLAVLRNGREAHWWKSRVEDP